MILSAKKEGKEFFNYQSAASTALKQLIIKEDILHLQKIYSNSELHFSTSHIISTLITYLKAFSPK